MKKFMMLFTLVAAIGFSACGQKLNDSKVPAAVKAAFVKHFSNVSVKWEMEGVNYEANFTRKGNEMSAVFDSNGNMMESEVEIKTAELPAAVIDYVKSHYGPAKIKEAAKITKADGKIIYEAEVKGSALLFDATGAFLKEEKD